MLRWGQQQRTFLAETLRDAANVAAGALVFGQSLSEHPFSLGLAVVGIAVWTCLIVWALRLSKGEAS